MVARVVVWVRPSCVMHKSHVEDWHTPSTRPHSPRPPIAQPVFLQPREFPLRTDTASRCLGPQMIRQQPAPCLPRRRHPPAAGWSPLPWYLDRIAQPRRRSQPPLGEATQLPGLGHARFLIRHQRGLGSLECGLWPPVPILPFHPPGLGACLACRTAHPAAMPATLLEE